MVRYYKRINDCGSIEMLFTYDFEPILSDPHMVEITAEEYARIEAEITAEPELEPTDEISDSEALSIILGGDSA